MTEEQAKARFLALNAVRFLAVAMVFAGTANVAGKLLPGAAPFLGYVLLIVGALDFFLAPKLLKKYWQKQDK